MLANAEVQVLSARVSRLEVARAVVFERGLGRRREIRRAAEQPRNILRERIEDLTRRVATGDALGVGGEDRQIAVPACGKLPPLHLLDLGREFGVLRAIGSEQVGPLAMGPRAARADSFGEVLAHAVRNQKLGILGPAVGAFDQPNLVFAERIAVGGGGILAMRRAVADVAVEDDQRGTAYGLAKLRHSPLDVIDVVGVADALHVPAVAQEARRDIFGECDAGAAFDGDVVVVVDPAQVIERQVTGERRSFRSHAFHEAAVAAHRVDVVIEDLEARLVVAICEPLLRDRHPDAGRDALSERARRRFDAGDEVVLGMAGRVATELPEAADVVERDRGPAHRLVLGVDRLSAREMQHRPQQHRRVTVGEHEAIPVRPDRVLGVEAHDPVPERVDERRERHRRAGVTGIGRLHAVDRQRADGVDAKGVEILRGSHASSSDNAIGRALPHHQPRSTFCGFHTSARAPTP